MNKDKPMPEIPNWVCYAIAQKLQNKTGLDYFVPELFLRPRNVVDRTLDGYRCWDFDGPTDDWFFEMAYWVSPHQSRNYDFALYYKVADSGHVYVTVEQRGGGWEDVINFNFSIDNETRVFNKFKDFEFMSVRDSLEAAINQEKAKQGLGELKGLTDL